jgi:hypothetical protein
MQIVNMDPMAVRELTNHAKAASIVEEMLTDAHRLLRWIAEEHSHMMSVCVGAHDERIVHSYIRLLAFEIDAAFARHQIVCSIFGHLRFSRHNWLAQTKLIQKLLLLYL